MLKARLKHAAGHHGADINVALHHFKGLCCGILSPGYDTAISAFTPGFPALRKPRPLW
jgi:hypothetical protein